MAGERRWDLRRVAVATVIGVICLVGAGTYLLRRDGLGRFPHSSSEGETDSPQVARIVVSEKGYEPEKVSLRAGIPARLTWCARPTGTAWKRSCSRR